VAAMPLERPLPQLDLADTTAQPIERQHDNDFKSDHWIS
jgi:hypothetical protein